MDPSSALDAARIAVGTVIALAGAAIMFGASFGLLRFPDVYARAHAMLAADGAGAVLFLIGLAVVAWDPAMSSRLLLLALLAGAAAPLLAHAVVSAAHAGGLAPHVGARSGDHRDRA